MITACGEALIDIVVDESGRVASFVGGAPLNAARAVARLGEPASFLGTVSGDGFGRRIRALLEADGVQLAPPDAAPLPSPVAIAQLDRDATATYRFLLDRTAATALAPEVALRHLDPRTTALHVGTLGLVLEPLAEATVALVQAAPVHRLVFVDPNCRPDALTDRAAFESRLVTVLQRADLVKVSSADLAFLAPGREPVAAAVELQRAYGATLLVTDGPGPVHVLVAGRHLTVGVPPVDVIDTVGAGDTFAGGVLAWWSRNGRSRDDARVAEVVVAAVRFGVQVAGVSCQRAGANPPFASEVGWT